MNQRKLAISLAVIGAIAAPFAFRTYKMRPVSEMFVPYTAQQKERVAAYFKEVNNCQTITDQVTHSICEQNLPKLERGGDMRPLFSTPK